MIDLLLQTLPPALTTEPSWVHLALVAVGGAGGTAALAKWVKSILEAERERLRVIEAERDAERGAYREEIAALKAEQIRLTALVSRLEERDDQMSQRLRAVEQTLAAKDATLERAVAELQATQRRERRLEHRIVQLGGQISDADDTPSMPGGAR
jgi:chromosome segregation ATPase